MKKIIIAVGSKRVPKLNAVWEAVNVVGPTLDANAQFEVVGEEVPSEVRHTPLTRDDIMTGARRRAEALAELAHKHKKHWAYCVGLEGGLDVVTPPAGKPKRDPDKTQRFAGMAALEKGTASGRLVFLQNWAYVTDGTRGAFGQSGSILIPEPLAARVVDDGVELAEAIDAFAGGKGIRDAQGAWGIFTRNMITRQDAFRVAVINAFAPFFNSSLYR